ncbi:hypothetical protein EJB05_29023, partial [Eragrostis curvula]
MDGMLPGARLRDLPTFIRTMNVDDTKLSINIKQCELDAPAADGILLNTFDALERRAVDAVGARLPNTFAVGPLGAPDPPYLPGLTSSLWRDGDRCAAWLDGHAEEGDASVVYVNFGSITMDEFAWGLAAAGCPFRWVVRPDMVRSGGSVRPDGFEAAVAGRGLTVGWCDQEAVLGHRATGGFLSHHGWNSTLESVRTGVPMLRWPFFAEQVTNCQYVCDEWGVGMEMPREAGRAQVEAAVRELMGAQGRGAAARRKAVEWKDKAREAVAPGGSSDWNLLKFVDEIARATKCQLKELDWLMGSVDGVAVDIDCEALVVALSISRIFRLSV